MCANRCLRGRKSGLVALLVAIAAVGAYSGAEIRKKVLVPARQL